MCEIDWNAIASFLVAVATFWIAFSAWRGVDAWKKQFAGESRMKIAQDVKLSSYQLYETFRHLRSPDSILHNRTPVEFEPTLDSMHDGSYYDHEHDRSIKFLNGFYDAFIEDAVKALSLIDGAPKIQVREAIREIRSWRTEYSLAGYIVNSARKYEKVKPEPGSEFEESRKELLEKAGSNEIRSTLWDSGWANNSPNEVSTAIDGSFNKLWDGIRKGLENED